MQPASLVVCIKFQITAPWDYRDGSFVMDEQTTSISRYVIDFDEKLQTNLDNGRRSTICIVWMDQDDEEPRYTGQKLQE